MGKQDDVDVDKRRVFSDLTIMWRVGGDGVEQTLRGNDSTVRTDAAVASQKTRQIVFCVFGFAAFAVEGGTLSL